jgi:hypothetical protein
MSYELNSSFKNFGSYFIWLNYYEFYFFAAVNPPNHHLQNRHGEDMHDGYDQTLTFSSLLTSRIFPMGDLVSQ